MVAVVKAMARVVVMRVAMVVAVMLPQGKEA